MSEHKITKKTAKRILAGGLSAAMLLTTIPILTMNANGAGECMRIRYLPMAVPLTPIRIF